jgi:hypothetical protein
MALSAVLSKRRVDSRTRGSSSSGLSKAFHARVKLNSIGSTYPGGYKSLPGSNRSLAQIKKSDAEHFAGSPQQSEIQLNFLTYVPELNICGKHAGNF